MNTGEMNGLLSTLLADSSTNFYTTTERLTALNSACSYLNSELRILRNVMEITITPLNEGRVPIPTDFVSIAPGVQWRDSAGNLTTLEVKTPFQLNNTAGTTWATDTGSTPTAYVMEGSNIYLTPQPNVSGVLIFPYVLMPNKLLEDTDLPFFGDPRVQAYHDAIVYYAAWQLALKDRDFEAAQMFMQYFQARMIDLKENLRHTGNIVQPVWADTYSTA